MIYDARGVRIERDDLVVWSGRIGRTRPSLYLGAVSSWGVWGKVKVELVRHGGEDEWALTGVRVSVKPSQIVVIEKLPESPYE